ncbi:MAG: signal peptidase II [Christensenellales bacterium]|nr:signal peptidase II [Clostridiales bacterium]
MKKYIKYIVIELLLVGAVIAIDLITKEIIYNKALEDGKIDIIKNVLSFTAVQNTGASFGIFKDRVTLLAIVSGISAAALMAFMIYTVKKRSLLFRSSLILIIGGAIGNLVDRAWLGYVRDFVYFELIDFAVFNLADSALTIGTILLIVFVLFFYKEEPKDKQKENSQ